MLKVKYAFSSCASHTLTFHDRSIQNHDYKLLLNWTVLNCALLLSASLVTLFIFVCLAWFIIESVSIRVCSMPTYANIKHSYTSLVLQLFVENHVLKILKWMMVLRKKSEDQQSINRYFNLGQSGLLTNQHW